MKIEYLNREGVQALWARMKVLVSTVAEITNSLRVRGNLNADGSISAGGNITAYNNLVAKNRNILDEIDALKTRIAALEEGGGGDSATKLFSFGLFSDIHISTTRQADYPNGESKFRKGLNYCKDYGVDFVTVNGDISVEQLKDEFQIYKDIRADYSFPIYANAGNHDMGRVVEFGDSSNSSVVYDNTTWKNYTGEDINFYIPYTKNGKKFYFIFLSCKRARTSTGAAGTTALYEPSDVTSWLTNTLASCSDGQCFVYVHAPLPERGNFGLSYDARSILLGTALTKIRALSEQYKDNTIWIHGHTHWAWENEGVEYKKEYQEVAGNDPYELVIKGAITKAQYDAYDRYNNNANLTPKVNAGRSHGWHLHVPSNCIARFYPTDSDPRDTKRSQFAVVDVYEDYAIVKGLSFDNTNTNSAIEKVVQYSLDFKAVAGSGGSDSGDNPTGGTTPTKSYIDESSDPKTIHGYVGETLDLGFTPKEFRRQNYDIFGDSTTDTSIDNRISMNGSKMTFKATANKNWSYGIAGTVDGLSSSSDETKCWFWTYNGSTKYRTIIEA